MFTKVYKTLHIIRGLPGSGKSTLARQIAEFLGCKHFEADQYFEDEHGNYNFDIKHISDAHRWCMENVFQELDDGKDVVVSNTFTTEREIIPYLDMVREFKPYCSVKIITCQSTFNSIHNVPLETYNKMKARFKFDVSNLLEGL